jgi:hypothetical protein
MKESEMYPPVIQYETLRREVEAELERRLLRAAQVRTAAPSRRRRLVARFAY